MNHRISILHTRVVAGRGGGPDKTIMQSFGYADRDRYDMAAAYLYPAGDHGIQTLRQSAQDVGMPFFALPEQGAIDRVSFRRMLDLCKRRHVDIWHSHDYKTDIMGLLLRRCHPMKLVTTVHGFTGETWKTRLYGKLNYLALLGYDHVAAVSPKLVRACAQRGVNPDRLSYLPNGIVLDRNSQRGYRDTTLSTCNDNDHRPAIVMIGRFSPEKGFDRGLRLFAAISQQYPQAMLHLVGDGPERAKLEQLSHELGIAARVRWWGWQTKTGPYLEMADALWLTSHTEGLPNVVLEAMAARVPVAATSVGAVPEVLDYGTCGVLLGDDEHQWPGQVAAALAPTVQLQAKVDAAATRLHERYDFAVRMRRVFAMYERVLERPVEAPRTQACAA